MKIKTIKKAILILLVMVLLPIYSFADNQIEINKETGEKEIFKDIKAPNLLLAETDSGRILYEREADKKIYPASITKLMTAILVIENSNLDEIATVSENAVMSVPSGYVNANLQVGEELTVENLLYAMLIPSANDAANVLAEHVGGSIESFASMMNTRAKELGCTGSNFTNPSGLHEKEHYTTTRDLFLIAQKAVSNKTIKKIIGTVKYTLPKTNKYNKKDRIFTTTNYMKQPNLSRYYYKYCIGAKTGYTGNAKNCVVSFAEKDGIKLTAIVMGENAKVKGQKFLDAKEMFEYTFNTYKIEHIAIKNKKYENLKISNATKETKNLDVMYKENVNILKKDDLNEVNKTVEYYKRKAPIQKGEIIGKITYEYDGTKYSTELLASTNVEESKILKKTLFILLIMLIIYILYNYKKSNRKNKNGNKNCYSKAKRIHY